MNRKKLKSYFEGKGCKCYAHNASECGCNVDWTPKEVYELRLERDEARVALARITEVAQAVVDRWEQPAWKDTEPTATVIYRLRDALGREAE